MSNPIALTQETYDKFQRAAAAFRGGSGRPHSTTAPEEENVVLKVASSTIGTYGYPANFQRFDASAGTWGNDPDRSMTVYLIDPAGGAYTSGQYADARFLCYRGAANSSVYEAVKQSGSSATTATGTLSHTFGAAAGSSPTLLNLAGTAYGGTIYFTAGTAVTTGTIVTITFSGMGTRKFRGFNFSAGNQHAGPVPAYTFATTGLDATGFGLYTQTALTASTAYQWNWMCFTDNW